MPLEPDPSGRGERLRLDAALVARGLAESRAVAQRLILAGEVRMIRCDPFYIGRG